MKRIDLSPYFSDVNADEGQARWDRAPVAFRIHVALRIAHAAGIITDPGDYDGPEPETFHDDKE